MLRRIVLSICASLMFAVSASAQMSFAGEVVEVIDGRTVVVAVKTGKVKVELQYIEVPEPGQHYHNTVKEHLRNLVIGKVVEYRPRTIFADRTIGRLLLKNDLDVSQQMLRDGAAWHIPLQVSGQKKDEYDLYASLEAAARNEKRGIWSVAGMKPAWEFRAEKQENQIRTEQPSSERPEYPVKASAKRKQPGYWGDENPAMSNIGALIHGYNAATKTGYVTTSLMGVEQTEEEKAEGHRTAVDITYWYKEDERKGRTGVFVVTVASNWWRFPKDNDLVLLDEKDIVIGRAKRKSGKSDDTDWETLTYEVQRSSVEKLVNSNAKLKISNYVLSPKSFAYTILYNVLQASGQNQLARASKSKP